MSATGSTTDDGIHHGAGMAYEKVLLQARGHEDEARARRRRQPAAADLRPARALAAEGARFIGETMRSRDIAKLKEDIEIGVRLARVALGLDVSDVQLAHSA